MNDPRVPSRRAYGTARSRSRWPRPPRAVLITGGTALAIVLTVLLAIGPIVRAKVASEATRRRVDVEVGSVRPGFFAVTLRDVRVRPQGVAGVEARLEAIRVDLGATLSVTKITASGGGIFLEGEPEDLAERLRAWRSADPARGPSQEAASRRELRAENLSLSWKVPSGGELAGTGLFAIRDENGTRLGCARCTASHRHVTIEVTTGDVELRPDGVPLKVVAKALAIAYEPPHAPKATTARPPPTSEPTPPPLPALQKRTAAGSSKGGNGSPPGIGPAPTTGPEEPLLPLPDLHALRTRIATGVAALGPRLPDGGNVEVAGFSAKLDIGGEPVAFGPGALTLSRNGERVHLGFASAEVERGTGSTPLSIDADIPLGAGEITARLAGGPVSLALLGVKEGTKGLTDVANGKISGKGQVSLAPAGDALTFDGTVALHGIALKQVRIAPEPMRGIDVAIAARGVLDDAGKLRVDDAQLDMGALHMKARGTVEESPAHFAVALAIDVAPASCQALLESAPQGLLPTVRAVRMSGTFGANIALSFDTRTIDKLVLDYQIDDRCKMAEVPRDLSRDRFTTEFTYRTYHPDGTIGDTVTGPNTPAWTSLDDISPFMVAAVLTTEDGAFYKHHGFNHSAIRSSVQANLRARRFVRGASTISMQLAKNLFLARNKALSRKIEEMILTDYLEQIFRKDDMMELYLNVVEFGPDVYGITQAAEHYFGRKPEELNLPECFFLSSLLPAPLRYGKLKEKGSVEGTWLRHLQALMGIAAKNGKITQAELEEGLKASISFVQPGGPRPEPRKPVTSTRRDPYEDDAAWKPLD